MELDTFFQIIAGVLIPVVAWITARIVAHDTSIQLLKQSLADDKKRNERDRREMIDTIGSNHRTVMTELKAIRNGK